MKQNLPLKHLFSLVMLLVLAGIHSCKKDILPQEETAQSLIANSKSYFEQNVLNSTDDKLNGSTETKGKRQLLGKTPLWDDAFVKKTAAGDAVMVPVHFDKTIYTLAGKVKQSLALDNLTYLMMYKTRNGKMQTEVVSTFPDDEYWDEKDREKKPFRGMVVVEDWQGNFIKSYGYAKDGTIYLLKPSSSKAPVSDTQVNLLSAVETCYTQAYRVCVEGSCSDWQYDTYCSYSFYDTGSGGGGGWFPSPGDYLSGGGGSGTGGTPNPCGGIGVASIQGDTQVNRAAYDPCDPVPGPILLPDEPTAEPVPPAEVKDSLDNPCFKNALSKFTIGYSGGVASTSSLGLILNLSFGLSKQWNIIFKDSPHVMNGNVELEGSDQAKNDISNPFIINITINLSESQLGNSSQEYIAVTLLHEIEHAYLRMLNPQSNESQQHEVMAGDFMRGQMTVGLQLAFPNLSLTNANALAWGGLNENANGVPLTQAWVNYKAAHPSQAYNIQVANTQYQTGQKGSICP